MRKLKKQTTRRFKKRWLNFVDLSNQLNEWIEFYIELNPIWEITGRKSQKVLKDYFFPKYSDMTKEEWNHTAIVWRLSNSLQEFEINMDLDLKNIYRYYTYKLLNDYSGEKRDDK